jgi:Family of unknown function (DUF5754)
MILKIIRSHLPSKKFDAVFTEDGKIVRTVPFGAKGYPDYTTTGDVEKRRLYRLRHAKDNLDSPYSPGALSMYILWGSKPDLGENLQSFKKRFKLQ